MVTFNGKVVRNSPSSSFSPSDQKGKIIDTFCQNPLHGDTTLHHVIREGNPQDIKKVLNDMSTEAINESLTTQNCNGLIPIDIINAYGRVGVMMQVLNDPSISKNVLASQLPGGIKELLKGLESLEASRQSSHINLKKQKLLTSTCRRQTGKKLYKCMACGKHFADPKALKQHYSEQIGETLYEGKKRYQCNVCRKYLTQQHSLESHLRIHKGEKPFPCGLCRKTFRIKSNLRKHMATHQRREGR